MRHSIYLVSAALLLICSAGSAAENSSREPGEPPVAVFVFKDMSRNEWQKAMADWRADAKVAASHVEGDTGGNNTAFAQSFIPHCERIAAIEVRAYPVSGTGWIRLDIHADDGNRPSDSVLSRTWLRVDRQCPIPHRGYMVFDVPDVSVVATQKYWFTFVEFVSNDSASQSITNLGSSRGNGYREGQLLRGHEIAPSDNEDANFRVFEQCPDVPGLREATEDERDSAPSPIWSNGHWREIPPCATRDQRESGWSSKVLGLIGRLVVRQEPYAGAYGLSMDLYNDSGRPLLIPLWNAESLRMAVWSQDGQMVSPIVVSMRAISHSAHQVSLPAHGYIGYSIPGNGKISTLDGKASVEWNGQRWTLPAGVYEFRGEYQAPSASPSSPDGTYVWAGRLTLPPIRIKVKMDGTAEPQGGGYSPPAARPSKPTP